VAAQFDSGNEAFGSMKAEEDGRIVKLMVHIPAGARLRN
jgi:hypothetical protein